MVEAFQVGAIVELKVCAGTSMVVEKVLILDGRAYDPPYSYRMESGAFWPHQCLQLKITRRNFDSLNMPQDIDQW